jgi:hypothetical protein
MGEAGRWFLYFRSYCGRSPAPPTQSGSQLRPARSSARPDFLESESQSSRLAYPLLCSADTTPSAYGCCARWRIGLNGRCTRRHYLLGGDISSAMLAHRGVLAPHGGRLTEAVALARRFPLSRIIFTGGSSDLLMKSIPETVVAEGFLAAMGVASDRTTFESRSRNTMENATLTRDLVSPKPGERGFSSLPPSTCPARARSVALDSM